MYDHSLNIDRLRKIASLTPTALKYFRGEGVVNPQFAQLRSNNDLIPRTDNNSEGGFGALMEAALGVATGVMRAKTEQRTRKATITTAANQQQLVAASAARIVGYKTGTATNGMRALFGRLQNTAQARLTATRITVYYYDAAGRVLQAQEVQVGPVSRGAVSDWSSPLLNVRGATKILPVVTGVQLSH